MLIAEDSVKEGKIGVKEKDSMLLELSALHFLTFILIV